MKAEFISIQIGDHAGNVECNPASIRCFLSKQGLSEDNIKVIIDGIEGRENGTGSIGKLSFTLSGGEFKLLGDDIKLICNVKKLGLRDANRELVELRESELKAIKEKMEKLGRNKIDDKGGINPDGISLHGCVYKSKVYVATSTDALKNLLNEGCPAEEHVSLEQVEELKGLDGINKALQAEMDSLNQRRQKAAKAIFGSEEAENAKDAFILRIPAKSGATGSKFEVKNGVVEYRDDNERIIICKNANSFSEEYQIVMKGAEGKWVVDNGATIQSKIEEGKEITFKKKSDGENVTPFTYKRSDLYKETKDIEDCWKKFSEEVNGLYKEVTGVEIKSDSGGEGEVKLYAYEVNGRVYVTVERSSGKDLQKTQEAMPPASIRGRKCNK